MKDASPMDGLKETSQFTSHTKNIFLQARETVRRHNARRRQHFHIPHVTCLFPGVFSLLSPPLQKIFFNHSLVSSWPIKMTRNSLFFFPFCNWRFVTEICGILQIPFGIKWNFIYDFVDSNRVFNWFKKINIIITITIFVWICI